MSVIGNPIIAAVPTKADSEFDENSVNPIQNKTVASWVKEPELTLYQDEDTKLVYVATLDGVLLGDGILVEGGGGGGGGGGSTYTPKLTNLMDSRDVIVAQGTSAVLRFRYVSVDGDGVDDGPGSLTVKVNNIQKMKTTARQGDNSLDITDILEAGSNTVVLTVENSESISKTLKYNVTVVAMTMTTTFSPMATYSGAVTYFYTIVGAGTKTVHFVMDGVQIGTAEVTTSGRSQSYEIPVQAHGGHVFEAYATMISEGMTLRSNTLQHGMLWVDQSSTTAAIVSTFDVTACTEGELLSIPYLAYDPLQETATVTMIILNPDRSQYSSQSISVGRTPQTWNLSDYPSGEITIQLYCGSTHCDFPITVTPYSLPVHEVTDSLVLEFDADGRSNGEANPAHWEYGEHDEIVASFSGFGWAGADGWLDDDDGTTILRFLPGDTMSIPFYPFASDARDTGLTVEVEMATRDVRDYESVVISCMSDGTGFRIASQEANLTSEQSSISMLFKEDSKVRVTFSVENRNQNRLVYIYINGIMCGVTQYPVDDNFQQANPVGLTIGAASCGLDLYKIRLYTKGLNRAEQLDNFIIDRPTLADRTDAYERNDILNDSDEVAVAKLPDFLPYMIVKLIELPQYKGDKKSGVEVEYHDTLHPERDWTATGVEMDVQGTSSQGYPVKNYKIKLKNGITYTQSGDTANGFAITPGDIPTKTICYKADYASSENANNVVLAKFYNDIVPYQTEPQEDDSRVRQGIDGFGIALFWQNSVTNEVTFLGKGNCNIDKGNANIFGFTNDYPNAESWEFKNNTSSRVLFQSADFTGSDWLNDFEARYPDTDPEYEDPTRLSRVCAWVASTDRDAVNTAADKAARLQKFTDEFENYFYKTPMLFMYLFTEAFLMVDNRAKNMFLTTYDGTHWIDLPYDFDTAIGIDNEGALSFGYSLEDTDQVSGADVYNGQHSVLWCNIRDGFSSELRTMYAQLRSMVDPDGTAGSPFSYEKIARKFLAHQDVWPEAMWNEDAFIKYLQPYLLANENYLAMLQGKKESQRDWWLFNRFRYLDSKYECGDAVSNFITLRCYQVGDITLTPYSDIYARVKYGSHESKHRVMRNTQQVMENTLDQMNDTETYIYSSDRISSVGDLSPLHVGLANFSMAPKLREIKLGDESPLYENTRLGLEGRTFDVGSNDLLETVNIANCSVLGTGTQKTVDLSGCSSLKTVIATGTSLRGVTLPNGGHVQTLKMPATLTNFTILNQKNLSTLVFEGLGNITTLRVENTPNVPIEDLILQNPNLNRVRLINLDYTVTDANALEDIYDVIITCGGIDAAGGNTQTAVVTGILRVSESVPSSLIDNYTDHFPDLLIIANGQARCTVRFRDWDGTVLDTQTCNIGGSVLDPVASGRIQTPTRDPADRTFYTYAGWDKALTNIQSNLLVNVIYSEEHAYVVTFVNDDAGETVLYTELVHNGGNATDPVANGDIQAPTKAADAQYVYTYIGWQQSLINITADRTVKARYATDASITVTFVNWDNTVLDVQYLARNGDAIDPVTAGTIQTPTRPEDTQQQIQYTYTGWDQSLTRITENTVITAVFQTYQYCVVTFKNPAEGGGATLYTTNITLHGIVTDPVVSGAIETPTRAPAPTYNYVYKGWDAPMSTNVTQNLTYTAVYRTDQQFTVSFFDWDGTRLDSQLVEDESDAIEPVAAGRCAQPVRANTPQYIYTYTGWTTTEGGSAEANALTFITSDRTIYAAYSRTDQKYTVRFYNGSILLQTVNNVLYGQNVPYTGTTPRHPTDPDNYEFIGWEPSNQNIQGNTDCYAAWLFTGIMTRRILSRTISGEYANSLVTKVGNYAFYNCQYITTVSFPVCTMIGDGAFRECTNLTSVSFPACTNIGGRAFNYCYYLTTASFPSCTSVGNGAFMSCTRLTTVSFPSCTSVGSSAFYNCTNLTTVSFPSCTLIEGCAFYNCSNFTTVSLPMCTTLKESAFYNCRNLTTVSLPMCTSIGMYVFMYCSNLTNVLVGISQSAVCYLGGTQTFTGTNQNMKIYVPDSLVTAYKSANNWSNFESRIFGISEFSA